MTKVLIVDDEEVARLTLAEILRLEGYEIKAVNNGEAAVQELRHETYNVMILDLKMTGMSGIDVIREIVDQVPGLAVIVLTAYGTMDSAIQALRYRVRDYLLKPASPEQVLESIKRVISRPEFTGQPVMRDKLETGPKQDGEFPGGAQLAWDKRQISWQGGSLSLTPTEARLLRILYERRNEVVPHSELVYLIQGYQIETEEAAKILRPVVSRLRHKLSSVPGWSDRIKNIRAAGYLLELP